MKPESKAQCVQDQRLVGSANFEKQITDGMIHYSIFLKSELLYAVLKLMLFSAKIGNNPTVHQWENGYTIVVLPCEGIVLSRNRDRIPRMWFDVDESQRHYAEPKSPDTKECLLYDSPFT